MQPYHGLYFPNKYENNIGKPCLIKHYPMNMHIPSKDHYQSVILLP